MLALTLIPLVLALKSRPSYSYPPQSSSQHYPPTPGYLQAQPGPSPYSPRQDQSSNQYPSGPQLHNSHPHPPQHANQHQYAPEQAYQPRHATSQAYHPPPPHPQYPQTGGMPECATYNPQCYDQYYQWSKQQSVQCGCLNGAEAGQFQTELSEYHNLMQQAAIYPNDARLHVALKQKYNSLSLWGKSKFSSAGVARGIGKVAVGAGRGAIIGIRGIGFSL